MLAEGHVWCLVVHLSWTWWLSTLRIGLILTLHHWLTA